MALCESRWGQDPDAYADWNQNKGVFQIWKGHLGEALPADTDLLDDAQNIQAAHILSAGGTDWSRWSCRP